MRIKMNFIAILTKKNTINNRNIQAKVETVKYYHLFYNQDGQY